MTIKENILEAAIIGAEIKVLQNEFRRNCACIKMIAEDNQRLLNQLDEKLNIIQALAEERDTV